MTATDVVVSPSGAANRPIPGETALPPRPRNPRWVLPALLTLLVGTAVLYLCTLGANASSNTYYAAAVQAGSESWKAWFFGAIDAASSITVDKPPASLWVMGLSARIFGYSTWSMLVPQVLAGVATVALLYGAVRRVAGPVAGLIAGAVLALTPAAALIFRFNNPDALLLLLVVAATYAITRAMQSGATRWLIIAGAALGFGFLTKSGQSLLVLPALALAYLILGPRGLGRRIWQLLLAAGALIVSAGWWIVAVALWPASSRPYIGGSTNNSPLELAFGYNGLGRLFGGQGNGGGGGGGGAPSGAELPSGAEAMGQGGGPGGMGGNSSFGGSTGLLRLFQGEFALEISWLIPAALIALVALIWLTRRARRTDQVRAAAILWGGSLLITGLVFSFMQGTIHPYYSVALAPSIAALVAIGGHQLWARKSAASHVALIMMVAATAGYGSWLLATNDAATGYVVLVAAVGALAVAGLVVRAIGRDRGTRIVPAIALVAALAVLLPVGNWGARTAVTAHMGSIPTAVSTSSSGSGMGGPGGRMGRPGGTQGGTGQSSQSGQSGTTGGPPGTPQEGSGSGTEGNSGTDSSESGSSTRGGGMGGGMGGPDGAGASNSELNAALKTTTTTWSAATVGAQGAAELELSTDTSIIAIGGFTGSDNAPTLTQFKQWVSEGKVSYFIAGQSGGGGGRGSSGAASAITEWVQANYKSSTIGGTTVYDLTS